ncbi:MAG: amino acid ABC transporter substrate-binding protein [Desulfobacteraceae bacterium]|nr:amino acid ABC transporter substrate-binding protein [Desulfobacteraceae bacterium]
MTNSKRKFILPVLILSVFFITASAFADGLPTFQIMTEKWTPWQVVENGEVKGVAVDLLAAMLQKCGSGQTQKDMKMMPWARSYKYVQEKENTILFSMTRTEERENLFKWVGPIFQSTFYLMARKDGNIKISSAADIKKYKIGTIIDDVGEMLLKRLGVPADKWERVSKNEVNVQKLNAKRVDLVTGTEKGVKNNAKTLGIDPDQFEPVFTLQTSDISYALYKGTPDAVINQLQKALDDLRADGTVDNLKNKYEHLIKK